MQMLTHLKEKGHMMAWGPLCLVCVSGNPVQPGRAAGVEAGRLAAERERVQEEGGRQEAPAALLGDRKEYANVGARRSHHGVTLDDRVNRDT